MTISPTDKTEFKGKILKGILRNKKDSHQEYTQSRIHMNTTDSNYQQILTDVDGIDISAAIETRSHCEKMSIKMV